MKNLTHSSRSIFRMMTSVLAFAVGCLVTLDFAFAAKDPTDVTAAVAAAVQDGKLSVTASNDTFGDTALGVPKKLRVEYTIGAEKLSRDAVEGGKIEIAAPAGQKLVILRAVYGPADTNGRDVPDRTRALKYGAFVHYVWGGTGTGAGSLQISSKGKKQYKNVDEMIADFPVDQFADDIASMGVEYLIFTCWHYDMNPLYPSKVMDKWMAGLPKKTPKNDFIDPLIKRLAKHNVKVMLYIHPDDGHDFTAGEKAAVGYGTDLAKYMRFMTEMYDEVSARYKGRVIGYWNDHKTFLRDQDIDTLRETIKKNDPDAVCLSNFSVGLRDINSLENPFNINDANSWRAYVQHVSLLGTFWYAAGDENLRPAPDDLYRLVVMQAGANTQGMGIALSFGVFSDGVFPGNVEQNGSVLRKMQALGKLIDPVSASIKNTYASRIYRTVSGTSYNGINWGVATDSTDGKYVYLHVLKPASKSIAGKTLSLPAPTGVKKIGKAVLLKNGNEVKVTPAPDGKTSFTLSGNDDWDKLDTIIRIEVDASPVDAQPDKTKLNRGASRKQIPISSEAENAGGEMWRFNLSWLLAGTKTGNGEVPKWVGERAQQCTN